ncbi:MAG: B12-binding domain-containing radical SAM protein [Magnetovibrionaceae bacterium]
MATAAQTDGRTSAHQSEMVDCLVLVKRLASEPDMIARMIWSELESFTEDLSLTGANQPHGFDKPDAVEMQANHGMSGAISLTSIVLGTALKEAGISFAIIDDDNIFEEYRDIAVAECQAARVIALSTTYVTSRGELREFLELVREVAPDTPIILGGQGLQALTLDPFSEKDAKIFDHADVLMFGEADDIFGTLVQKVRDGESLEGLDGVMYRKDGVWEGSKRPVSVDLEKVPIPDYSLIDEYRVNGNRLEAGVYRPTYASLEEGRGCAFKCRFCSYHVYSGFRRKSPERVVKELQAMKEAGFSSASFVGAEFLAPIKHSTKVFEAIRDSGLEMSLWPYARLDLLARHPDMIPLLAEAGIDNITFGMESGDETVLTNMKKYYRVDEMVEGAKLLKKSGISVTSSVIIGYPGETPETVKKTTRALIDGEFDYIFLHPLGIVPDTPLWHLSEEYGIHMSASGIWSHNTMSLHEIPGHVRDMVIELTEKSRGILINILRNHSVGFVQPTSEDYDERLDAVTLKIQKIISECWQKGELSQDRRDELWADLMGTANQLPKRLKAHWSETGAVQAAE